MTSAYTMSQELCDNISKKIIRQFPDINENLAEREVPYHPPLAFLSKASTIVLSGGAIGVK